MQSHLGMVSPLKCIQLSRVLLPWYNKNALECSQILKRNLHVTVPCYKSKAGRHKSSKMNNKPLTYDQAFKPHMIGVTKNWLSVHTGNLHGEKHAHRMMYEDQFIRRFLTGTFYRIIVGEVLVKQVYNNIEIVMFVKHPTQRAGQMHFLKGYSERLLSAFLKCNVKLHMHKVLEEDMQYKFI